MTFIFRIVISQIFLQHEVSMRDVIHGDPLTIRFICVFFIIPISRKLLSMESYRYRRYRHFKLVELTSLLSKYQRHPKFVTFNFKWQILEISPKDVLFIDIIGIFWYSDHETLLTYIIIFKILIYRNEYITVNGNEITSLQDLQWSET